MCSYFLFFDVVFIWLDFCLIFIIIIVVSDEYNKKNELGYC